MQGFTCDKSLGAVRDEKTLPAGSPKSGSSNAATRHTGLTRARHSEEGRTAPVSERLQIPSARKAGTSNNQTQHDNRKETGRSKIFAHKQHCWLNQANLRGIRSPPDICHKAIKPSVRFRMSSPHSENDFIAAARLLRPGRPTNFCTQPRARRAWRQALSRPPSTSQDELSRCGVVHTRAPRRGLECGASQQDNWLSPGGTAMHLRKAKVANPAIRMHS